MEQVKNLLRTSSLSGRKNVSAEAARELHRRGVLLGVEDARWLSGDRAHDEPRRSNRKAVIGISAAAAAAALMVTPLALWMTRARPAAPQSPTPAEPSRADSLLTPEPASGRPQVSPPPRGRRSPPREGPRGLEGPRGFAEPGVRSGALEATAVRRQGADEPSLDARPRLDLGAMRLAMAESSLHPPPRCDDGRAPSEQMICRDAEHTVAEQRSNRELAQVLRANLGRTPPRDAEGKAPKR